MSDDVTPPVNLDWSAMNKKDKQRHLRRDHGRYVEDRVTVESLDAFHEVSHKERAQIDAGEVPERWRPYSLSEVKTNRLNNWPAHDHTPLTAYEPSEEEQEALQKIREGLPLNKVLPAGERKVLSTLVDNDFAALAADMRQMAADTKADRMKQVEAEWASKREEGPRYAARVRKAAQDFNDLVESIRVQAQANGITVNVPVRSGFATADASYEVTGEKEARGKVSREVETDLARALLALERQRLSAQRIIALSGVTKEAQVVLNRVPDAKTLMVEAAKQRAAKEVEGSSNKTV